MDLTPKLNMLAFTVHKGFSVRSHFVHYALSNCSGFDQSLFHFVYLLFILSPLSFETQKIRKQETLMNMRCF